MDIKKVGAEIIRDSRGEKTILVWVRTKKKKFIASSPSGKSKGKYEVKSYKKNIEGDVKYLRRTELPDIFKFEDLKIIESIVSDKIGGNSLFALEAVLLKALAYENKMPLWKFLSDGKKIKKLPRPVGNAIGGGMHSTAFEKKPDFQEFLFIPKHKKFAVNVKLNHLAYLLVNKILKSKKRNDEGAWQTQMNNESVLSLMDCARDYIERRFGKFMDIGIDVAASSFYNGTYNYKNPKMKLSREKQVMFISRLIKKYDLKYLEDGLNETDFAGFKELRKKSGKNCLIVGDDLTTTNPNRLMKAIKNKSINAVIVKPNQIGSLLKVREVMKLAKSHGIKTIISHRSGETLDYTIADLAVAWSADYIKCGIYGASREAKLKRLVEISRRIK